VPFFWSHPVGQVLVVAGVVFVLMLVVEGLVRVNPFLVNITVLNSSTEFTTVECSLLFLLLGVHYNCSFLLLTSSQAVLTDRNITTG